MVGKTLADHRATAATTSWPPSAPCSPEPATRLTVWRRSRSWFRQSTPPSGTPGRCSNPTTRRPPRAHLVLHALAERITWRRSTAAKALAEGGASDIPATTPPRTRLKRNGVGVMTEVTRKWFTSLRWRHAWLRGLQDEDARSDRQLRSLKDGHHRRVLSCGWTSTSLVGPRCVGMTVRGRTRANGEVLSTRTCWFRRVRVGGDCDGDRRRKYVYGPTREIVHDKWLSLHRQPGGSWRRAFRV